MAAMRTMAAMGSVPLWFWALVADAADPDALEERGRALFAEASRARFGRWATAFAEVGGGGAVFGRYAARTLEMNGRMRAALREAAPLAGSVLGQLYGAAVSSKVALADREQIVKWLLDESKHQVIMTHRPVRASLARRISRGDHWT